MKQISRLAIAFVCVVLASASGADSFKIKVDLADRPEPGASAPSRFPKGAEKASERYFRFAEKTHPVLLSSGHAALLGQQKKADIEEDMLDDLDMGPVAADAIQKVDKDVDYAVRANSERKSFVLLIVNRKKENLTAEVELKRGRMLEPVYRQVYSEDGGKTWTTAAWQPPRAPNVYPWTVEVPANSAETVTICLK
ncbi:MAG: hypothetical protein J6Q49_09165 [Kiritimatiellae bacterium]|nr:hypothetical protein [Kiritimatiellia bacterium]